MGRMTAKAFQVQAQGDRLARIAQTRKPTNRSYWYAHLSMLCSHSRRQLLWRLNRITDFVCRKTASDRR